MNSLIAQIMSIHHYSKFNIEVKRSDKEGYQKEVSFSINGHYSFSLHISSIDEYPPNLTEYACDDVTDYLCEGIITLKRVAPDWEPDSDDDELSYNEGDAAYNIINNAIQPWIKRHTGSNNFLAPNCNFNFQLYKSGRWSHSELCAFYPDRPSFHDGWH